VSRLLASAVLTVALTFALADRSAAAELPPCNVPGGTGAVDQYCVEIPTADGLGDQTDGLGGPRTDDAVPSVPLREVLSAKVVEALARSGPVGRALLRVPMRTPAHGVSGPRQQAPQATGTVAAGDLPRPARDPIRALGQSAEASVLGGDFRWALSVSTVALFAAAWWRLRRVHAY
jgi:hypothetical protein